MGNVRWELSPAPYDEEALGCSAQTTNSQELLRLELPPRGQMPLLDTMEAFEITHSDEDDSPFICPPPVDNSPAASRFFPVSSYAFSDAPMRKALRMPSRHVKFASSPTHSVHRS